MENRRMHIFSREKHNERKKSLPKFFLGKIIYYQSTLITRQHQKQNRAHNYEVKHLRLISLQAMDELQGNSLGFDPRNPELAHPN